MVVVSDALQVGESVSLMVIEGVEARESLGLVDTVLLPLKVRDCVFEAVRVREMLASTDLDTLALVLFDWLLLPLTEAATLGLIVTLLVGVGEGDTLPV